MKVSKLTFTLLSALVLSACTNMSNDGSLQKAQQDYQQYQDITKQYQINEQWWLGYNDTQLNRLVETALANNINLAKTAISVNKALYNANLVGANLVPTFTASEKSSASKGVGSSSNLNSTGTSSIGHQIGLNLSYTLDLWGRLRDTASAAEWEHKATQEDLQAARLSLINAVVSSYYNLAYYQDAIRITQQSVKSYEQINHILSNKFKQGLIDQLSVDQSMQAVLSAQNALINLQSAQKSSEQVLRNLLNLKPNEPLVVNYPSILKVKLQDVDVNVPVSTIANRPDVLASLKRLQGAFKNLTATENSWFPTVTLGGSLTGSSTKFNNTSDNLVAGGVVSFDLPFLDWNRVQNNIKISEEGYKLAKLNYEQTVTTALNEIDTYYSTYQLSKSGYANLQKKYEYDRKISGYYKNRYEQGISELRESLSAMNTERSSELSLLENKYTLLKNENAIYQAMAGKYRK
ncbi:TolC family protein [Glaesserella parasuis]|uniref:toxin/drug exporter TdeA n=1 Tax=Glaesserella parasuis TaxID=738 RepID=UPI002436AE16|nr:TolC family protein [Glaesserella parasuis]MDG6315471.1 TolC family protein [Glaesserella parasuis]MDO9747521.1 TolC family protein [Glaesserella parasuis]MDO9771778.1 TolC family protein [Glaesserella parasuis]MDO9773094.1 TolC family protein [Glaesserella parasuis]MDO9802833.1 TolC family protein [Glaesserella parasuis]